MKQIDRDIAITLICKTKINLLSEEEREGHILNMWSINEDDIEFNILSTKIKKELLSNEYPPSNLESPHYNELILLSLKYEFIGVTNKFISNKLIEMNLGQYDVCGEVEKLVSCPCCNYLTLEARGEYDICPLCYWQDVGIDELDIYVSANRESLGNAKRRFDKIKNTLPDIINKKYLYNKS